MTQLGAGNRSEFFLQTKDWQGLAEYLHQKAIESWCAADYFAQGLVLAYGPISPLNPVRAAAFMEKAAALEPENLRYITTLSELYLQIKRPAMALRAATLARFRAPQDPLSGISLSRAALKCGEIELSKQTLAEVYRQLPSALLPSLRLPLKALHFCMGTFWQQPCTGKRLALVRMASGHREFLTACRKNRKFQHQYHLFQGTSPEAIERDLKEAARSPLEIRKISWVVESKGVPVGLAALVDLDIDNARAEILVGLPEERSFGMGLEATLLIMEFAFATLGLEKLVSYVYGDNPKSQHNTMHLGFHNEGKLMGHIVDPASKKRLDLMINGCSAQDFFENSRLMAAAERLLGRKIKPPDETISQFTPLKTPEELMLQIAQALTTGLSS